MSNGRNVFKERSFCVASDFSLDEIIYLYKKGRELKEAWNSNSADRQKKLAEFRINSPHLNEYMDPDFGVYDAFFEPSTRTDHSTKNAAKFHYVHHLSFDPGKSSLSKQESYADTFMTLAGYNNKIFIVRTTLEGVCRWLSIKGNELYSQGKLPFVPAFINAGDGKHEHPTQELLDEFTFLEDNNWELDNIHIALVGDLLHGRTVHSKVQGLKIYKNVKVDLVAPEQIQMPAHYLEMMNENGYEVRVFESLEEYYKSGDVAGKQYFTRPQLERMGDEVLKRQKELRDKIIFKREYMDLLPEDTFFYHPFPRHREHPTIPEFLDKTPLNHYSEQSNNGKIMRIILISALAGRIGHDFEGQSVPKRVFDDNFVKDITPDSTKKKILKEGINPLSSGVVIDHILKGKKPQDIWDYLNKILKTMDLHRFNGSCHVGTSKKDNLFKGMIFLPKSDKLTDSQLRKLAAITGGCTVNHINKNALERKMRLNIPPRVYGISGTGCKNKNCISHSDHLQHVPADFVTADNSTLICSYCDTPHKFNEVWR